MNPKPYDEYKDSGVDWIGSVPAHWPLSPLRSVVEERRIKNPDGNEAFYLSLVSGRGVIPYSQKGDIGNKMPEDLSRCKVVEEGDLVINSMNYGIGSYGVSSYQGICSPVYIVLRPKPSVDVSFIKRIFEVRGFQKLAQSFGSGILEHRSAISWQTLKTLRVPVPTLTEQRVIAEFLDRETAEIDAFIADQERLIELLEERRAATITHAVTKGLDPNAPMKDSGIEGLGDIPEHWVSGPVKRFFVSLDSRRIPLSSEERSYRQGPFPYYGASGIIDMIDDFLFEEPLVLVSEDGANLNLRSTPIAFVATGKYWVNNHAHILRPRNEAVYFWAERLEALDISPWTTGAAQPKLTAEALMNLKIAVPSSFAECLDIQEHILQEASEIDAAVSDAREAIALSRERRAALISAAVTGQVDVSQDQRPVDEVLEEEVRV